MTFMCHAQYDALPMNLHSSL